MSGDWQINDGVCLLPGYLSIVCVLIALAWLSTWAAAVDGCVWTYHSWSELSVYAITLSLLVYRSHQNTVRSLSTFLPLDYSTSDRGAEYFNERARVSAIVSSELNVRSSLIFCACYLWPGGSVAEWLACWTQAQKARVQITVATLSDNSLRQTAYTHCASVHQAAKLVAALLRVAGVTAGLAESNGSLLPGLWLTLPAGWLPRTGISSGTLRSVIEWATFTFFYLWPWRLWQWLGPPLAA